MNKNKYQPLADKLRPKDFGQIVGQKHLFGDNGFLTRIKKSKKIPSLILWGNAGSGKTTIAKLLAKISKMHFEILSATNSGSSDLRKVFEKAYKLNQEGLGTILMVDEIHHFNKSQQDLFLPHIENGNITLIGATTQNPSFELNSALLSRCKIITLNPLETEDLEQLIAKAEDFYQKKIPLQKEAKKLLMELSCGDGRYLLNSCEELFSYSDSKELSARDLAKIIQKRSAIYDKNQDAHYGLISALHKSMRGSDVDAALYYLARMLVAGEDPHYLLRRITRFASEDIGVADPNALLHALAAKQAYDFLGSPEGDYAISNAVIYMATAPKSNACYLAHKRAVLDAQKYPSQMPPKYILNAPTKMMKEQGFGDGYIYDHDTKNCFSGQEYFPEELAGKKRPKYYLPNKRGFEREIMKRLEYWQKLRMNLTKISH